MTKAAVVRRNDHGEEDGWKKISQMQKKKMDDMKNEETHWWSFLVESPSPSVGSRRRSRLAGGAVVVWFEEEGKRKVRARGQLRKEEKGVFWGGRGVEKGFTLSGALHSPESRPNLTSRLHHNKTPTPSFLSPLPPPQIPNKKTLGCSVLGETGGHWPHVGSQGVVLQAKGPRGFWALTVGH